MSHFNFDNLIRYFSIILASVIVLFPYFSSINLKILTWGYSFDRKNNTRSFIFFLKVASIKRSTYIIYRAQRIGRATIYLSTTKNVSFWLQSYLSQEIVVLLLGFVIFVSYAVSYHYVFHNALLFCCCCCFLFCFFTAVVVANPMKRASSVFNRFILP